MDCNTKKMEETPTLKEVAASIDALARDTKLGKSVQIFKKSAQLHYALYLLIKSTWEEEQLPQLWWKTAVVEELKSDHCRFISILNFSYKILGNILLSRVMPYFNKNIRTTYPTEQIFMLRQILERCWEYNIPLYQVYVIFDRSYRSVNQELIPTVLAHFDLPKKIIKLIELTVRKIHYRLNVNGDLTIIFLKYQGLRERDVMSPFLLDIMNEYAIRQLNIRNKHLIRNDVQFLGYGNEMAIVSPKIDKAIEIACEFHKNLNSIGLGISKCKTKFLITSRNAAAHRAVIGTTINIDNFKIKVVDRITFLGTIITDSNNLLNEIKYRLSEAARLFKSIQKTVVSPHEMIGMYKKIVRPIALYGSQAWTLSNRSLRLLKRFEEDIFRMMFNIDPKHNRWRLSCANDIRELINLPDITLVVRRRRLQWLGHIIRSTNIINKNIISKPTQKRLRGRPRLRWRDCVFRDLYALRKRNWKDFIIDKNKWKNIVTKTVLV